MIAPVQSNPQRETSLMPITPLRCRRPDSAFALLALMTFHPTLLAGGIYVPMKGATATGLANVGLTSSARDGSTLFYNPAGMTRLGGTFVEIGIDAINADIAVDNRGSRAGTLGTGGQERPYAGSRGHGDGWIPVPNLFLGTPIMDGRVWMGLAVTAPFGLQLDYGPEWFGRYDSYDNSIQTLDIAPTLAYRINEAWSIGGGIDVQYADAELISALPDPLNPGGPTPATDGRSKLTGDGWDTGFNIGLLYQPSEQTRVGLHYRSGMGHLLKGSAEVSGLSGPLAAANGRSNARTRLDLPDILSLSLTQAVTPQLTLMGEVQWFGWDALEEIRVRFANGTPDLVRPQGFENTFTVGLAAEYALDSRWTLRGGIQYDQSPTTDALRNTSIPDSDLLWLGVGASYGVSERLRLDVGYAYGIFERADIDLTLPFYGGSPLESSVEVRGETDSHVDVLSLSVSYRFGG
ncbi:Membrane protein involved in aromatic hydrocarbon degradation [Thiocapsa sp. KS1]|nr:outer membrane protein transport protein [Thiocapsa sp. KS1]CRI65907.1 Membrane protein involved in aromatic hydrocarbon degradation [Thiocapsa sp. KS1]